MEVTAPIKTLHEAVNLVVVLDLDNGSMIRGRLVDIDDAMNATLEDTELTRRDKTTQHEKSMFVRGSAINFFVLPPAIRFAPFLLKGGTGS
eukprot:jgi/Antlo1/441/1771